MEEIEDSPVFTDNTGHLVPDPLVYSDWFNQTDDARRKLAVGARRFATVQDLLGTSRPGWEHFLNPETGKLLTLQQLIDEEPGERATRIARVRAIIARRGQELARVARFGSSQAASRLAGTPA